MFFLILSVRLDRLQSLNFEGCHNLTDNAFKFLLLSNDKNECLINPRLRCESKLEELNEIESGENDSCKKCAAKKESFRNPSLVSINLSGCWSISDFGLR